LTGAVTDAIGPVALSAEAGIVTGRAPEFSLRDRGHVVDAALSTWSNGLGSNGTSKDGEDSEGLHLEAR
jgi:hypothetical protein